MAVKKLTNQQIKDGPAGRYGDGGGLSLRKTSQEKGKWIVRFVSPTKGVRRETSVGTWPKVSLAEARKAANDIAAKVKQKIDPIDGIVSKQITKPAEVDWSFAAMARACFEAKKATLKGEGKAGRWFSPLETHVIPQIGHMHVETLKPQVIVDMLIKDNLWHNKRSVADKAYQRTINVLQYANAELTLAELDGLDTTKIASAVRDILAMKYTRPPKAKQHIPSMHRDHTVGFYADLTASTNRAALALRLLILTGVRSSPVRLATRDQFHEHAREYFDRKEGYNGPLWVIPAENQKGKLGKTAPHHVPLSGEAWAVVQQATDTSAHDMLLFAGNRGKNGVGPISDMTMSKLMRDMLLKERPHGFRATVKGFMDYSNVPDKVSEMILSHKIGNEVAQSYNYSELLIEARADALNSWADFVAPSKADNVVNITA